MQSTPPAPNASPKRPWKKWGRIAAIALLVISASVWAINRRAPKPDADIQKVVKYVASERFADLTPEQKQPYLDRMRQMPREDRSAMRDANLSEDEHDRLRENAFGNMMGQRIEGYFALPAGPQRLAFLDKMIDEGEQWRQRAATRQAANPADGPNAQGNRPDGQRRGGRGGGWNDPARMKKMIERMPPTRRTQFAEFFSAMEKRRAERGLPPMRGPGGR